MQSEDVELAEKDYIAGMKYREIADKYGVTIDTVKSWKKRKGWVRPPKSANSRNTKNEVHTKVHTKNEIVCTQNGEVGEVQQCQEIDPVLETGLTAKQLLFCVFCAKSLNATKAYQKAYGCDYYSAAVSASRMLKNVKIQNVICEMRVQCIENAWIREEDILQQYIDIARADIHDFVTIENGDLKINENMDGTIVKSIKMGKYGIEVQLCDRLKALQKLEDHIDKARPPDEEAGGGIIEIVRRLDHEDNMGSTEKTS